MTENFIEEERQVNYFHFSASQFYEDFSQLTRDTIIDTLNTFAEMLVSKFPKDEEKLKLQVAQLAALYIERSKEPLEKMREVSKEIFALPSSCEDEIVTSEEVEKLRKEVAELQQDYVKAVNYRACLQNEVRAVEHIQPLYDRANKVLQFYKNNKAKPTGKSLHELLHVLDRCKEFYCKKQLNRENKSNITDNCHLFKVDE